MQRPFAHVLSNVVEKVRKVERVVPVEGSIRIGGARATAVSFLFFFSFVFILTAEFASVMYEKEKRDRCEEGKAT